MLGREKCIECGRQSPETNGETTLTTSYGWRLRRAAEGSGHKVEWRCPACWQRFKATHPAVGSAIESTRQGASTPPSNPPPRPVRGDGSQD